MTITESCIHCFPTVKYPGCIACGSPANNLVDEATLREQIAGEALELLKHLGFKPNECGCPAYPDGETWDGHMCMEFQLLDLITKDEKLSDAIAGGKEIVM